MQGHTDLKYKLPVDKYDTASAEYIVALGYPANKDVLPDLLEWIQDGNWPVAKILIPFLATVGLPLVPHIQIALRGHDQGWKYFILNGVIAESQELAILLFDDLHRLATAPTSLEKEESLDTIAIEIFQKFGLPLQNHSKP